MAGYQKLSVLLKEELDQLSEEGFLLNKADFVSKIDSCGNDQERLLKVYEELRGLPRDPEYPYIEPVSFEEITAGARPPENAGIIPDSELKDKLLGAWYGRCIGCALGQPVEGWSREQIREWCGEHYPVSGYIPTHSDAEEKGISLVNTACTDELLHGMPSDDDIRFTVLAFDLVEKKGLDFDTWDVGANWLGHLPIRFVCTAETQSYLNFANMDSNGPWGEKPRNAPELARESSLYLNPYREWIGAQIRIDAYGYVSPGKPALAAKMAYEDASFSHTKNGVYGAVFFAALISCAFNCRDIEDAFACALTYVPETSRFYEAAVEAAVIGRTAQNDRELLDKVLEIGREYNWVHTINNAAVCIAALIYAKGNFEKSVTLAVMAGMDTDCNGATVGSVAGIFSGYRNIPQKFTLPLEGTLRSELPEYHPVSIASLAERTFNIIKNS